ncbi:HAD family hydrolase [Symbioplanes lichenis]|uniref:HAD family hydrolase n=1 Tax=Symbioplanes lichenis TaxID=1629072 RepID=UPI002738E984|nr:HAD family phosphatase [Actinoplanes lichenis]
MSTPITRPLAEVVSWGRYLLLDFDGPLCSLFAGHPARAIAAEMSARLPLDVTAGDDPLALLRAMADRGDRNLIRAVADHLRDAEIIAAGTATPTPGAEALLKAARDTGRAVIVVSNNAVEAVDAYLAAHDLTPYVRHVAARFDGLDPRRLKPNPFLVRQALADGGAYGSESILIGDSPTDILAGRADNIPTIGYANELGKNEHLTAAGAHAITTSMTQLAEIVRRTPFTSWKWSR